MATADPAARASPTSIPRVPSAGCARRKVAVFASRFLPYSQTFIYDQVRGHQRYTAHVFSRQRVNADSFPFSAVHYLTPGRGWRGEGEAAVYRATCWSPTFARILRAENFCLLHGHFGSAACYALPYASRLNLPLVVSFHGYDVPVLASRARMRPSNWPYWALSKWLFRQADLLLPVSNDLAALLVRIGAPAERIRVHRLGVNTDVAPRSERGDGRVNVLMVGRFVEKKGFHHGIRAFGAAAADHPEARLLIVGDGPMRSVYQQLIADLGLADRVQLLPPLPHDEVLRLMQSADVALVPSVTGRDGDREGGPLVIREAAAVGLAILATRHGAIPEVIVDGVTGLLADEGDIEGLTQGLRWLLAEPEGRRALGREGRHQMRRLFDQRDRMAALEQLYDEVLDRRLLRSRFMAD